MAIGNEAVGKDDAVGTVGNLAGLAADDVGGSDARPPTATGEAGKLVRKRFSGDLRHHRWRAGR